MIIDKLSNIANMLTDANRAIRLRLATADGVVDDLLLIKYISGKESMCGGLEYVLRCVSSKAGMELKKFIANPVEVQFVTDTGKLRSVCGIISAVTEGQNDGGLASYELVMRDVLSLMEQTCNTRVFRNCSEIDITETLLKEWIQTNPIVANAFRFEFKGLKTYPSREFTMQFNESTSAFLRRLWRRRGISWFIQSQISSERGSREIPHHTLVLFDDSDKLAANPAGPARYHRDDGTEQRDSIIAWHGVRRLTAGRTSRWSADYKTMRSISSEDESLNDQGISGKEFASLLDDYLVDPPHAGDDANDYRSLGLLRIQRKEYEAKFFQGESSDREMRVGQWRRISGHREIDSHRVEQQNFICTELQVEAENNFPTTLDSTADYLFKLNRWDSEQTSLIQSSVKRGVRYTNRFSCVRRGIPIVPFYDPRIELPRTETQTAIVVGPAQQEIYCDESGRVKVRFPACRPQDHEHAHGAGASGHEWDSAWVRVSTGWAGNRYGTISLPRVGDEVVIIFMGGDPDKPLIIGSVHNTNNLTPSFNGTSVLPADRHLSGIISKEGQGLRGNQLRMDDTPGQISAQLGSDHGHSQLNLGFLTQPRHDGSAARRGEGAELRTDAALSLRGGQGILISADASLRAAGRQLDRDGLAGLADAFANIQKQLAELAKTHETDPVEVESLEQVKSHIEQWENGSNTASNDAATGGGSPIVAIEAPAGLLLGSKAGVAIGAQTNVDVVSVRNTQVSAGRKLMLHALQGISFFAHSLGTKLVAASGKVEVQAHDDNVEITSAKRIVLSASEEIVLQAPKVNVISQGAQAAFGGGAITHQCTDNFVVRSATAEFTGAGDGGQFPKPLPESEVAHDQRVRIVDMSSRKPFKNQRYRITMEDGEVIEGITADDGMTQEFTSKIPFGSYIIEAIYD